MRHLIRNRRGRRSLALLLTLVITPSLAWAADWPQWLGAKRDGVWREKGILDRFPPDGPRVKWRQPVGAGYSGPAVAGGKVYLTDHVLAEGTKLPASGFDVRTLPGTERVLCLDVANGKQLWKHEYPCDYKVSYASGPRATPLVEGDRVWTLGTMGHLHCLDTKKGDVIWSKDLPSRREMEGYLRRVREGVLEALDRFDFDDANPLKAGGYIFQLVLEHERQHQETLCYLLQLLDPSKKTRPPSTFDEADSPRDADLRVTTVEGGMVSVPAGEFLSGAVWDSFAYDNEYPAREVFVPEFRVARAPVNLSNASPP